VPSLGYRIYEIQPGSKPEMFPRVALLQGPTAENRFFRVTFDLTTGGLTSIFDKRSNRELLDPASPYRANQYLYATGGEGTQALRKDPNLPSPNFTYHSPEAVRVEEGPSMGPLFGSVIVRGQTTRTPRLESEIVLYDFLPRIDFINRLTKDPTYDKEAVYFAFPFAAAPPEFAYEIPDGIVHPATDMLQGACLDWFCVQHWVDVSDASGGVTWASPDTPLVCLGDLTVGRWLTQFRPPSGSVFAYAMNNYWDTNYKAGQGGDFTFRYALTGHAGGLDPVAATRFGWEVANPLLTAVVPPWAAGTLTEPAASFCVVEAPNVVVLTLKQAEDGQGWIVRLWEVAGQAGTAPITFPCWQPREAFLTDLVEENPRPLSLHGRTVTVPIDARGVMTVRVR
jgi:alpha-mannosidase